MGTTTTTTTQQTGVHNSNLLFQNLLENNQLRTSTMIQTPQNGTSPTTPANLVEGITQIMNQVTNNNKRDDTSKQMMKNIKIFDGSNKAECINWLNQVEAAAKFTNTPFRELICQSMAPAMLHMSHFAYVCKTEGKNGISRLISALCVNCLISIPEYSRLNHLDVYLV